jgi:hypothetical protein
MSHEETRTQLKPVSPHHVTQVPNDAIPSIGRESATEPAEAVMFRHSCFTSHKGRTPLHNIAEFINVNIKDDDTSTPWKRFIHRRYNFPSPNHNVPWNVTAYHEYPHGQHQRSSQPILTATPSVPSSTSSKHSFLAYSTGALSISGFFNGWLQTAVSRKDRR